MVPGRNASRAFAARTTTVPPMFAPWTTREQIDGSRLMSSAPTVMIVFVSHSFMTGNERALNESAKRGTDGEEHPRSDDA
jgi:hypothetical protein